MTTMIACPEGYWCNVTIMPSWIWLMIFGLIALFAVVIVVAIWADRKPR